MFDFVPKFAEEIHGWGEVGVTWGKKREIFKIQLAWPGTSGTTSDLQPSAGKRIANKLAVIF